MCLFLNEKINEKVWRKLVTNGKATFYKQLNVDEYGHVSTPFRGAKINSGWYKSDRQKQAALTKKSNK